MEERAEKFRNTEGEGDAMCCESMNEEEIRVLKKLSVYKSSNVCRDRARACVQPSAHNVNVGTRANYCCIYQTRLSRKHKKEVREM